MQAVQVDSVTWMRRKKPLLIPPEFATYAEKHEIFQIYERLLQKLIINQPDEPLQYLLDLLHEPEEDVPQIILLGPPGSGKTSLAKMVVDELNCVHISKESLLGSRKSSVKEPVPTETYVSSLKERLQERDCINKGWLIEGFPETKQQAQGLQAVGITPRYFVLLDAPDRVLMERVIGKRVDPLTGDVFHTTFDPPDDVDVIRRLEADPDCSEEVMVTRLKGYHRNIDGIISCYSQVYKMFDADQPKSDIYAQIFKFLTTKLRTNAPHTPRVILLGPMGSGKSVQASLLASKYQLVNVSCGELVKEALANKSKLGEAMRPYVERGSLVPDDLVIEALRQRLGQLDAVKRGWVLHGFPKTRSQAEALVKAGYEPNRVILLDVPTDIAIERLSLRGMDPVSGNRYHLLYAPPKTTEVKDRLKTHPEDEEMKVHKKLAEYQLYLEDIVDYFENTQRINADQDLQTVFECVESIVVNPLPKLMELSS